MYFIDTIDGIHLISKIVDVTELVLIAILVAIVAAIWCLRNQQGMLEGVRNNFVQKITGRGREAEDDLGAVINGFREIGKGVVDEESVSSCQSVVGYSIAPFSGSFNHTAVLITLHTSSSTQCYPR